MVQQHPLPVPPPDDGDFSSNNIPEATRQSVQKFPCHICGKEHEHYKLSTLTVEANYREPNCNAQVMRVIHIYLCQDERCRDAGARFAERPLTATIRKRRNA